MFGKRPAWYRPWMGYAAWAAALAGGSLAWFLLLGVIGLATLLACGEGCRTGGNLAWLGAVASWLAGSLAMAALVAVGLLAGRRDSSARRARFRTATIVLAATVLLGLASLVLLPAGNATHR
ncbi:hypothetical protein DPM19_19950 [Actinomadura craniellae]|uniref:Transmembrane protein n=1 Tax=Actinomadura craniellae TaxID=2231787 RepID=A0A365H2M9_9ACTN|nr:hypothetical protein [Actinomadura craniellae]RAY13351.1 hypothetical protein DPM19_19950 [Actinomadura craniellae]